MKRTHQPGRKNQFSPIVEALESRQMLDNGFLSGVAFIDSNSNGMLDDGEERKVEATIELRSEDGSQLITSVATDNNGIYVINDIEPGTYRLVENTPGFFSMAVEIDSPLNPATAIVGSDGSAQIQVTVIDPADLQVTFDSAAFFALNRFESFNYSVFGTGNTTGAGQMPISVSGPGLTQQQIDFLTFCVDLFNDLGIGINVYNVVPNSQPIGSPSGDEFPQNGERVAWLYNNFGRELVADSITGAGLQLAIWELLYDNTFDLTAGNFAVSSPATGTTASEFTQVFASAANFNTISQGQAETATFLNVSEMPQVPTLTRSQGVVVPGALNFANIVVGSISGMKFNDIDGDGTSDGGSDPGVGGVTINLFRDANNNGTFEAIDDTFVGDTTTAAGTGAYSFENLIPGTYFVFETNPAGTVQTTPNTPGFFTIVLNAGDEVGDQDFGNFERISIFGRKFDDLNGDGDDEQGGDPGLGGVTISLFLDTNTNGAFDPNDDTFLLSTVTADQTGAYSFSDLVPGTYFVVEQVPGGSVQTFPAGDGTHTVVPMSGQDIEGLDFGNVSLISLSGRKFFDANADGDDENGADAGLGGVTIELYLDTNNNGTLEVNDDQFVSSTLTAPQTGAYSFGNLVPGAYIVREIVPSGQQQTFPAGPGVHAVNTESGQSVENLDFGNFTPVNISGRKFDDFNGDGSADGDPAIAGVTINLFRDTNNSGVLDVGDELVDSTTTRAGDGAYFFLNLAPDAYFVAEEAPGGQVQTFPVTPTYHTIDGTSGAESHANDFGNFELINISGIKFQDNDGDGVRDGDADPFLPGVTIYLDLNFNDVFDQGSEPSTVTGQDGSYSFTDLGPGAYRVREFLTGQFADFTQTTPNPADITAASGFDVTDVNFGNQPPSVDDFSVGISGIKFEDLNGNGIQDSGEGFLPGVTIFVDLNLNEQLDSGEPTSVTNDNGRYTFEFFFDDPAAVPPLRVREVQPTGFTQTTANPEDIIPSGPESFNFDFGNMRTGRNPSKRLFIGSNLASSSSSETRDTTGTAGFADIRGLDLASLGANVQILGAGNVQPGSVGEEIIALNLDATPGRNAFIVFEPLTGREISRTIHTGNLAGWTDAGDKQLVGDVDGDGTAEVVFFNRSSNTGGAILVVDPLSGNVERQIDFSDFTGGVSYGSLLNGLMDAEDSVFVGHFTQQDHLEALFFNRTAQTRDTVALRAINLQTGQVTFSSLHDGNIFGGWLDSSDEYLVSDTNLDGYDDLVMINRVPNPEAFRNTNKGFVGMVSIHDVGGPAGPYRGFYRFFDWNYARTGEASVFPGYDEIGDYATAGTVINNGREVPVILLVNSSSDRQAAYAVLEPAPVVQGQRDSFSLVSTIFHNDSNDGFFNLSSGFLMADYNGDGTDEVTALSRNDGTTKLGVFDAFSGQKTQDLSLGSLPQGRAGWYGIRPDASGDSVFEGSTLDALDAGFSPDVVDELFTI